MKNAAYTAAKKLEVAITTLFNGFSNSVGTTGQALTDAVIREAISVYTGTSLGNKEEAAFILHPKTIWEDVMAIDRFALSMNTNGVSNPLNGQVGRIYGIPVIESANVQKINTNADYSGALANPDAIHWATSPLPGQRDAMGVRLQANYIPEYLSTLVTADILYGAVENRDAAGVEIVSAV